MPTSIPTASELRVQIRDKTAELHALRRLLRLAEAAEAAQDTHLARRPQPLAGGGEGDDHER